MSRLVELKLRDFGVEVEVKSVSPGPVITRFELQPAAGVKSAQISNLAKDLARGLSVISVRVVEVIPGKTVIGLETQLQLAKVNEKPDVLIACCGGGSNFAGLAFPFMPQKLAGDDVDVVIHYDPPEDDKAYVHRSGRTARAGAEGIVVSLVNNDQRKAVAKLIKAVGLPRAEPEPEPAYTSRSLEDWVDQRPDGGEAQAFLTEREDKERFEIPLVLEEAVQAEAEQHASGLTHRS